MADMTPQEQLMLELINRARMDPDGEAKRYHIALNEGPPSSTISSAPKQVLAGSDTLAAATDNHGQWMLTNNTFAHQETSGTPGFTGVDPDDRMKHAGYPTISTWGENIAVAFGNGSISASQQTKFIQQEHKLLFVDKDIAGRGHRLNILNANFQEIGVSQQIGDFSFGGGSPSNSSMVTQDFATRSGSKVFVTGVVYNDTVVKDDFFSVGEQVVGRGVSSTGAVDDQTGAGGGYELLYSTHGAKLVSFEVAGGTITVGVKLGATNVKVDLVNGKEVWSDTSISSVSSNVTELHALGIANIDLKGADSGQKMYGNSGDNVITGNAGHDRLYGKGGDDTFVFLKGDTSSSRGTADTIYDFKHGDIIDLSHQDADSTRGRDQKFTFIEDQAFHKVAGELHYIKEKSDTWIEGDTDGNGEADFIIHLDDAVALTKDDFHL